MYTRILVAVDGSETSKLALAEALALAEVHRSQLRIVHVVAPAPFFASENRHAETENLEADLVAADIMNAGIADMIAEEAAVWHADLIVVGTHWCRGLSHLFLGSLAERVARAAAVPVLLIREKQLYPLEKA